MAQVEKELEDSPRHSRGRQGSTSGRKIAHGVDVINTERFLGQFDRM